MTLRLPLVDLRLPSRGLVESKMLHPCRGRADGLAQNHIVESPALLGWPVHARKCLDRLAYHGAPSGRAVTDPGGGRNPGGGQRGAPATPAKLDVVRGASSPRPRWNPRTAARVEGRFIQQAFTYRPVEVLDSTAALPPAIAEGAREERLTSGGIGWPACCGRGAAAPLRRGRPQLSPAF